jgi:TadE-like protein
MATAELALVLPAVLLVLAVALSALGLAIDQIRCVDAARAGARAAARRDTAGAVTRVALRAAPAGAHVETAVSGELVTVTVTAPQARLAALVPLSLRPGASATAQLELAGAPP